MQVKCWLAGQVESNMQIKSALALSWQWGKDSLHAYTSQMMGGISISRDQALIISGGRSSIIQFLQRHGESPVIRGDSWLEFAFIRKHKMFGKNETCVKIIAGRTPPPADGGDYENLGNYVKSAVSGSVGFSQNIAMVGQAAIKPTELAGVLQRVFD